jgi:hypothetical protein
MPDGTSMPSVGFEFERGGPLSGLNSPPSGLVTPPVAGLGLEMGSVDLERRGSAPVGSAHKLDRLQNALDDLQLREVRVVLWQLVVDCLPVLGHDPGGVARACRWAAK